MGSNLLMFYISWENKCDRSRLSFNPVVCLLNIPKAA